MVAYVSTLSVTNEIINHSQGKIHPYKTSPIMATKCDVDRPEKPLTKLTDGVQ